MKMSSLGVSIKNPQRDQVAQKETMPQSGKVQQAVEEDFIFNDRDLNFYWQQYAGQLPKEEDSLTTVSYTHLFRDGFHFECR